MAPLGFWSRRATGDLTLHCFSSKLSSLPLLLPYSPASRCCGDLSYIALAARRYPICSSMLNWWLVRKGSGNCNRSLLTSGQFVISVLMCLQIAIHSCWANPNDERTQISVPACILAIVATISLSGLSNLENNRSTRPSLLICTYLLASKLLDLAQARTLWLKHERRALAGLFTVGLLVKIILLLLEPHEKRSFLKHPYNLYPPEALAGVINRSLIWWLNMFFQKGGASVLSLSDLYDTDAALSSSSLKARVRTYWKRQNATGKHSLLLAMLSCFKIS